MPRIALRELLREGSSGPPEDASACGGRASVTDPPRLGWCIDCERDRADDWPQEPAERVRELVEGVLDELDLDGEVEIDEDDDRIIASVEGDDDYGLLIGKRGQTIDALQLLAYQAAFRGMRERKRVVVDAAGYRERRRETLTARADRAAEQALSGSESGRDGSDERPGAARRARAPEGAGRGRDLQRRRRAASLRRRCSAWSSE